MFDYPCLSVFHEQIVQRLDCERLQGTILFDGQYAQCFQAFGINTGYDAPARMLSHLLGVQPSVRDVFHLPAHRITRVYFIMRSVAIGPKS